MEEWLIYTLAGCSAVALLVICLVLAVVLKKHRYKKLGIEGEKKVQKKLGGYARRRGFKVINDIYLPLYDKTTQIDHILIGYFGIVVIETKNLKGEIYADARKKEWLHTIGEKRMSVYNPLMQNQAHIDCIRYIFNKEKIYNIAIDSLIVFTNKKSVVYNSKGMPIISISLLKKYLKKERYMKDNGIDVDKVYNALMSNAITDKRIIKSHVKNVKEMAKNNK